MIRTGTPHFVCSEKLVSFRFYHLLHGCSIILQNFAKFGEFNATQFFRTLQRQNSQTLLLQTMTTEKSVVNLKSSSGGVQMYRLLLFMGVLIVSFSGPMIKMSTAPAIAVAFYRVFIGFLCYLFVLRGKIKRYDVKGEMLLLLSGFFLSMHFFFWIKAFSYTTVAGAVVPLMLQPFVTSFLASLIYKEKVTVRQILSTSLVIFGVIQMVFLDAKSFSRFSRGDFLSILGVLFVCGFLIIGRFMVPRIGTFAFNLRSYGVASFLLLLMGNNALIQTFPLADWLIFLWLGVGCSFLGYSMINNSLKYFGAITVAMALVGEPVLSIVWSWLILKQTATIPQYFGLLVSLIGMIWFFVRSRQQNAK